MINRYTVAIPSWVQMKIWRIAYLIILGGHEGPVRDIIETEPDEEFDLMVKKYVTAALAGEEVPEAIAPAILNLADDVMSGREMKIRTGDYIALQKFARQAG